MKDTEALPEARCPNCRQAMQAQDFERHDHGRVRVYLCFPCAGFWFDHLASVQLAPAAVIELFKEIYAHRDDPRQPVAAHLGCPRCNDDLALSHDLCKSGRFSYFLCHAGHGRFTPFFQFLREKQFVRDLTPSELQRVRAEVRQVTCSECGAPIDLEQDSACKFCHAPISFLDRDAVEKAVRLWSDADHRRGTAPHPEALGDALLHPRVRPSSALNDRILLGDAVGRLVAGGGALDLVSWGIHAIGRLFENRSAR